MNFKGPSYKFSQRIRDFSLQKLSDTKTVISTTGFVGSCIRGCTAWKFDTFDKTPINATITPIHAILTHIHTTLPPTNNKIPPIDSIDS